MIAPQLQAYLQIRQIEASIWEAEAQVFEIFELEKMLANAANEIDTEDGDLFHRGQPGWMAMDVSIGHVIAKFGEHWAKPLYFECELVLAEINLGSLVVELMACVN